jgi:hypothetical protein
MAAQAAPSAMLMAAIPGEITFAINRTRLSLGITASDEEVWELRPALRFAN